MAEKENISKMKKVTSHCNSHDRTKWSLQIKTWVIFSNPPSSKSCHFSSTLASTRGKILRWTYRRWGAGQAVEFLRRIFFLFRQGGHDGGGQRARTSVREKERCVGLRYCEMKRSWRSWFSWRSCCFTFSRGFFLQEDIHTHKCLIRMLHGFTLEGMCLYIEFFPYLQDPSLYIYQRGRRGNGEMVSHVKSKQISDTSWPTEQHIHRFSNPSFLMYKMPEIPKQAFPAQEFQHWSPVFIKP